MTLKLVKWGLNFQLVSKLLQEEKGDCCRPAAAVFPEEYTVITRFCLFLPHSLSPVTLDYL